MGAPGTRIGVVAACLLSVFALACGDERSVLLLELQAARTACPPGHVKRDLCGPEPPPPPGDPQLPGVFLEGMVSPLRLDWTPQDWLLVTDSRLRMVLRIDPVSLQPFAGFRTHGKPLGVTALGPSIYVGNADDRTIDVYAADGGDRTSTFGQGRVDYPADLAADHTQGLIFALDGGRREVRVFNAEGTFLNTISGPGTLDEQLLNPTAVGLDPVRQWVMVSDYGSADGGIASLKIFAYDGSLVHRISGEGDCGFMGCFNGFSRPQGAGVDAAGLIYMPDALLGEIWVFDPDTWTRTAVLGGQGFLRLPTDVVVDGVGDLFIASNLTHDVQVIRGVGQP